MSKAHKHTAIAAISMSAAPALALISSSFGLDTNLIATLGFLISTLLFGLVFVSLRLDFWANLKALFERNVQTLFGLRVFSGLSTPAFFIAMANTEQEFFVLISYQMYPFLSIIIAHWLFPNRRIHPLDWVLVLVSLLAIPLLFSDEPSYIEINQKLDPWLGLAMLSGLLAAISTVTEPEITKRITKNTAAVGSKVAIATKFFTNAATAVIVIGLYLFSAPSTPSITHNLPMLAALSFTVAVLIDAVPGLFSRLAGPHMTSNSPYALWSLGPPIGIASIAVITNETPPFTILTASCVVVIGCAALSLENFKVKAFLCLSAFTLLVCSVLI